MEDPIESIMPIATLKIHMSQVENSMDDLKSKEFFDARKGFIDFVKYHFSKSLESSTENWFVNELLNSVSLAQTNQNLNLTYILYEALISIDIGDKSVKANKMSKDILSIQPVSNQSLFKYYKIILVFLNKVLKGSTQLIIIPLRDMAIKWILGNDKNAIISGFSILKIIFKHFTRYMQSHISQVHGLIISSLLNTDFIIKTTAFNFLRSAVVIDQEIFHLDLFCSKLNSFLNTSTALNGLIELSLFIIDTYPEYKSCFSLRQIQLSDMLSKDVEQQITCFKLIPLAYSISPHLLDNGKNEMYKTYEKNIKRRMPARNAALKSLGQLIFAHMCVFDEIESKRLRKMGDVIKDALDCDSGIFCNIAYKTFTKAPIDDESPGLKQGLSTNVVRGLDSYRKCFPEYEEEVFLLFKKCVNNTLTKSTDPKEIINTLNSFDILKIPLSYFDGQSVLKYSNLLSHPIQKIRKLLYRFIIKYHNEKPSLPILMRIISLLVTEPSEKLRTEVYRSIKHEPLSEDLIPITLSLVNDSNPDISLLSLQNLIRMTEFGAVPHITDLLNQTFFEINITNKLLPRLIRPFYELGIVATTEGKSQQISREILRPFTKDLLKMLLETKQRLSNLSLGLLEILIKIDSGAVDTQRLTEILSETLTPHSSENRLSVSLSLMHAALDSTPLRETIYGKHAFLIAQLHLVAKGATMSENTAEKLFKVMTKIGPIDPNRVEALTTEQQREQRSISFSFSTAPIFIQQSPVADPGESLKYAIVGVSLSNVIDILSDESLFALHPSAIEALLQILKAHRDIDSQLQQELIERVRDLLRTKNTATVSILLSNLGQLIAILGEHYLDLVADTVDFICDRWDTSDKGSLIRITEWMMMYVPEICVKHIQRIALLFLSNINRMDRAMSDTIFNGLVSFGQYINKIDYIVYPAFLNWLMEHALDTEACVSILDKLWIMLCFGYERYSSVVMRAMVRLVHMNSELNDAALKVLSLIGCAMGPSFLLNLPTIEHSFKTNDPDFQAIVNAYKARNPIPAMVLNKVFLQPTSRKPIIKKGQHGSTSPGPKNADPGVKPPTPDWEEDRWTAWMNETYNTIFQRSSSKVICACHPLSQRYSVIRGALFPAAFTLSYVENCATHKSVFEGIFQVVFSSTSTPPATVIRTFLNIVELFELLGLPTSVPRMAIGAAAKQVEFLPFALREYESIFDGKDAETAEQLISLNSSLGLGLAARGVLSVAKANKVEISQRTISEKLGLWEDALNDYQRRAQTDGANMDLMEGILKCYSALLRYEDMSMESERFPEYAAEAALYLLDHGRFLMAVNALPEVKENLFFRQLARIADGNYSKTAYEKLNTGNARKQMPVIADNYERAYHDFVEACMVEESKEVFEYISLKPGLESLDPRERAESQRKADSILRIWDLRMETSQQSPFPLLSLIAVRSFAIGMDNRQQDSVLTAVDAAIEVGDLAVAETLLARLQCQRDTPTAWLARCHLFMQTDPPCALKELQKFEKVAPVDSKEFGEIQQMIGVIMMNKGDLADALPHVELSVEHSMTAEKLQILERLNMLLYEQTGDHTYLRNSFEAALRGLALGSEQPLAFMLHILSIFFKRGSSDLFELFRERLGGLPAGPWIEVMPQVIALSISEDDGLRQLVDELILHVAKYHPNPVLYAIMVPLSSDKKARKESAKPLYERIHSMFPDLTKNIFSLSTELVRVAVTWWEAAYSAIDQASRLYSVNCRDKHVFDILGQLSAMVTRPPETLYEVRFNSVFGADLEQANAFLKAYRKSGGTCALNIAWEKYAGIMHGCADEISNMKKIHMRDASPLLYEMRLHGIAVPGTYASHGSLISIVGMDSEITVMSSKQHPRKITIRGSDGKDYHFLLKAHEDTRLDERVMQLFEFINVCVRATKAEQRSRLSVELYKVTPLTGEVGLIGWVQGCQTLYEVIRRGREKRGIGIRAEYDRILSLDSNYDKLPVPQKANIFRCGLDATKGDDIERHILGGSVDATHWLSRRTNYTASLAMTSIAGYILGLGDRHLQNIMMNTKTAKLVHIDFGDCFEVAMDRINFPEKVPFRLTRLLVRALEASGIEGTFRSCCESVLKAARGNSERVLGLLSAFLYDPLEQWREAGKAVQAVDRIAVKLRGEDPGESPLTVREQVAGLINMATDDERLCQMYLGWAPFW